VAVVVVVVEAASRNVKASDVPNANRNDLISEFIQYAVQGFPVRRRFSSH
jgi:hypothetical protein